MTEDTFQVIFDMFHEAISKLSDEEIREFFKGASLGPDDV